MIKGSFNFLSFNLINQREFNFKYDDEWLLQPTSERNFDLLKFSFDLAIVSALKEDVLAFYDKLGFSYTANIDYEKEGLNVLAGAKVTDSVYYPAQIVNGKIYYNSIAYAIGFKQYKDNTLILISIRGNNYGPEWGGNFNLGTGDLAEGFNLAAYQVIDGLKTTIKENNLTGKMKVLIAGYSRAAATANLVAAKLSQGEISGFNKENVFGFSFECPRNMRLDNISEEDFPNIISICNPNDLVPKVAESVFGYRRFGKTYYYPGVENDKDFKNKEAKMFEILKTIIPFPLEPSTNTAYLETNFINNLAFTFGSLENYVKNYQKILELILAILMGKVEEVLTVPDLEVLEELQEKMYFLNSTNCQLIAPYLGTTSKEIFKIHATSTIFQNHWIELNLAWLESLNGFKDFGSDYYKIIYFDNTRNIEITDSEGNKVASVVEGVIENFQNKVYLEYDNNDQLVLLVNPEEIYNILIQSNEPIKIVYTRFNQSLGLKDQVVTFNDLFPIDSIRMTIPVGYDLPNIIDGTKIIKPDKVLSGKDVKLLTVRIIEDSFGKTSGGGYFNYGEKAKVKVLDLYIDSFIGWFNNGSLVSKDPEYFIDVTESIILEARFY